MAKNYIFVFFCLSGVFVCPSLGSDAKMEKDSMNLIPHGETGYKIHLKTNGKTISANLEKSTLDFGILSKDFHLVIADVNEDGELTFDRWTPSSADLKNAVENIYVDSETNGIFHIDKTHADGHKIRGTIDNLLIEKTGNVLRVQERLAHRTDYIKVPSKSSDASKSEIKSEVLADSIDVTVEFLLVADLEFSAVFNGNYRRVLEYFIPQMWDINLRYKTLPSARFSWQLNGLVVVANRQAQPFVEESRASDGRVNHDRVLPRFSQWLHANSASLPPFDLSSLVTNAKQEWNGGLAYGSAACVARDEMFYGASVWDDGGNWGSTNIAAHELGHNLGSPPHDDDPNYPGGCSAGSEFIMGGSSDRRRFFFSSCSDRLIGNFVRSDEAACLRQLRSTSPAAHPDFTATLAPTMQEQCRRRANNTDAWITNESCFNATCNWKPADSDGWYLMSNFAPLDNSPCGTRGRCFRGKCRQAGFLIRNVGSGLCMVATDNFDKMAPIQMVTCPRFRTGATALHRFVITNGLKGTFLESPYIENGVESFDKCMWTGSTNGGAIWTDKCGDHSSSEDNPWHGWELINTSNTGQFLLKHKVTGRCAMNANNDVGAQVQTFGNCDQGNAYYRWTRN